MCAAVCACWANGSENSNKYGRMHAVNRNKLSRFIRISVLNLAFHFVVLAFSLLSICGQSSTGIMMNENFTLWIVMITEFLQFELTLAIFMYLFFRYAICVCVCGSRWIEMRMEQKLWPFNLSPINKNRRQFRGESFPNVISTDPNSRLTNGKPKLEIVPLSTSSSSSSAFFEGAAQHWEQFSRKWPLIGSMKIKENSFSVSLQIHTTKTEPNPKT